MSLLTDAPTISQLRRLARRLLTPAGNGVRVPVLRGRTRLDVTLVRQEVDTRYGVLVTPSWLTTYRVTDRTTTGFAVEFSIGTSGGTVDFLTFREE